MTALATITDTGELVDTYRIARERLDRGVHLLNLTLDLRERLEWGLDLDDVRVEVDLLNYAVKAHRWARAADA